MKIRKVLFWEEEKNHKSEMSQGNQEEFSAFLDWIARHEMEIRRYQKFQEFQNDIWINYFKSLNYGKQVEVEIIRKSVFDMLVNFQGVFLLYYVKMNNALAHIAYHQANPSAKLEEVLKEYEPVLIRTYAFWRNNYEKLLEIMFKYNADSFNFSCIEDRPRKALFVERLRKLRSELSCLFLL